MVRKITRVILPIFLVLILVPVAAASGWLPPIVDQANLLDAFEEEQLVAMADSIRDAYAVDVVILTLDTLDGVSAKEYAENYYDQNGYGFGSDGDGILLLLAMQEREWYISTCGNTSYTVTAQATQKIGNSMLSDLAEGDYFEAFGLFLDSLPGYLAGGPEMLYHESQSSVNFFLSIGIGAAVAAIAVYIMRSAMNTKRPQAGASSYLKSGSFRLNTHKDMFLYSNVKKIRRQQSTSTQSGRSGTRSSSGGRRHGGSGGRF